MQGALTLYVNEYGVISGARHCVIQGNSPSFLVPYPMADGK
jgi:hypothetical protein